MDNISYYSTEDLVKELNNRLDRLILFGYRDLTDKETSPIVAVKGQILEVLGMHRLFESYLLKSLTTKLTNPFDGVSESDFE